MSGDYPIPDMDNTEDELRAEIDRLQIELKKEERFTRALQIELKREEKFTMAAMDKAKVYQAALEEIRDCIWHDSEERIIEIARKALAKEGK